MGERARELLDELRTRWDDAYWWADHQLLQAVLVASAAGAIALAFKYLELRMTRTMAIEAA